MRLRLGCRFEHDAATPTAAIVLVEPHFDAAGGIVAERWVSEPPVEATGYVDLYGNRCRRLVLPEGVSAFSDDALVTELVVHERVEVESMRCDVVEPVGTHVAVAEAAEVGHDHLEARRGEGLDHLPEDALGLGPAVHAQQWHATQAFVDEGLAEAARRCGVDREPVGVELGRRGRLRHEDPT